MSIKFTELDFLRQLLKNAQVVPAQQAAKETTPPNPEIVTNVAKKLINLLAAPTGTRDAPFFANLSNLTSLLDYLAHPERKDSHHQGKRIVIPYISGDKDNPNFQSGTGKGAEYTNLSPEEKSLYVPYPAQNPSYYVYKDGLIAYLQNKQRQAVQEPNQLLGAMIGRLIDAANQDLQLGMSKDLSSSNQEAQDTELDSISNPLLLDRPLTSSGSTAVRSSNLKDKSSFNAFANTLELKIGDKTVQKNTLEKEHFCQIINFLYARAEDKFYRDDNKDNKLYLDLVSKLASSYSCSIGKTRPTTDVAGESTTPTWKQGDPLPAGTQQQIVNMRYPLLPDRIDFRWIQQWLQSYQAMEQKLGGYVDPASNEALELVSNLINQGFSSQSLHANAVDIYRAIYQRAIKSVPQTQAIHVPLNYLKSLNLLMTHMRDTLNSFKRDFWYNMPPEWQSDFNTQVNNTTNSYAEKAILQINQWINALPTAQTKVDKEIGG